MARQYSAHSFGLQACCHASCANRIAFTLEYIACFKLSLCAVRDEPEVTYRGGSAGTGSENLLFKTSTFALGPTSTHAMTVACRAAKSLAVAHSVTYIEVSCTLR